MRIVTLLTLLPAVSIAMSAQASADNCVNTAVNNPAFSSDYVTNAKPCPPPPAPVGKSGQSNADTPSKASRTTTASVKPVDPDHPTITTTPNGHTLLKTGDTTICMSGSVSATMVTGGGRLRGSVKEHDSAESACN